MNSTVSLASAGVGDGMPLVRRLNGFVRVVRGDGFRVGVGETLDALRLAGSGGRFLNARELRWGLRAVLCSGRRDWQRFDGLFDAYWRQTGVHAGLRPAPRPPQPGPHGVEHNGADPLRPAPDVEVRGLTGSGASAGRRGGAGSEESLAQTDFRHLHAADRQAVYDLAERLAARMRWRLSRRQRLAERGHSIDLRKTWRRNLGHGGVPFQRVYRQAKLPPVQLVVLLDASGSMDQYSAFFMRFMHGIVANFRSARAFVFHTRLAHLSAALRERDVEKSMQRLALIAQGWGGGTRIGHCLGLFNDHYGASALNRRTAVLILSDGYDTDPPQQLARQMARLRRRARKVIWLNPLLGWQGYAPVARGMAAALPHVDVFAPCHNLQSLMALEPHLYRL